MDSSISGKPSPAESLLSRRKAEIIAKSMAEIERRLDVWLYNEKPGKRAVKRARDDVDSETEDSVSIRTIPRSAPQKRKCEGSRFACPFAKHDPTKYSKVKTCCGPGWNDIHRVKEHLYRRHSLKNACNRCFEFFNDAKLLKEHQRLKTPCKLKDDAPTDVISEEQEGRLRARAKANTLPTEKWEEMYKIIFPRAARIPSPHYDSTEEELIAKAEEQSRFKSIDDCKAFVRSEFLRAVKPILTAEVDRALKTLQGTMSRRAAELFNDLQNKIVRTWQYQSEQAVAVLREPTPEPDEVHVPEAQSGDTIFGQVVNGLGDDPMFPFLLPDGPELDLGFYISPIEGEDGYAQGQQECDGSVVPDSAYCTLSAPDEMGSWPGGSYHS